MVSDYDYKQLKQVDYAILIIVIGFVFAVISFFVSKILLIGTAICFLWAFIILIKRLFKLFNIEKEE